MAGQVVKLDINSMPIELDSSIISSDNIEYEDEEKNTQPKLECSTQLYYYNDGLGVGESYGIIEF